MSQASGNARDLVTLKTSLQQIPEFKASCKSFSKRFTLVGRDQSEPDWNLARRKMALLHTALDAARPAIRLQNEMHEMPELAAKLQGALRDDPPLALKEGGIFADGFNPDLDELRRASHDGKTWITALQEREIETTGIKSLKVRFNSVFGYFIEITKSNLASVPAHYTRKQTTVGGERFITPELKEMEAKILGADERARHLEYQLFQTLRDETLRDLGRHYRNRGRDRDAGCDLRAGGNSAAFSLLPPGLE